MTKHLIILGIRGVPGAHGGFETFAEFLSIYLVKKGWDVTVYCQEDGRGAISSSKWEGVYRIHIPVNQSGPLGTIIFDWKSILHSLRHKGVFLTLGYNTAVFNILHRLFRKINIINMDGIEWKRHKWGKIAKLWFWLNERFGCWFGNHLVADHPEIENHLATRVSREKITMIPYGGKEILSADESVLSKFGLEQNKYAILIARAEPENSILEVVSAFSRRDRDCNLVVLGNYSPDTNAYHKSVLDAASQNVIFPGAIYDPKIVDALRLYARVYVHGHQVGGTNPSLVEALGAGNAILAHDNRFNRWVAKDGAVYFGDIDKADDLFCQIFQSENLVKSLRKNSRDNFKENFLWEKILLKYEDLLG